MLRILKIIYCHTHCTSWNVLSGQAKYSFLHLHTFYHSIKKKHGKAFSLQSAISMLVPGHCFVSGRLAGITWRAGCEIMSMGPTMALMWKCSKIALRQVLALANRVKLWPPYSIRFYFALHSSQPSNAHRCIYFEN